MTTRFRYLALTLLLALLLAAPALAESTAEARKWIEKMGQTYAEGPFSVDFDGQMAVSQMGQNVSMTMKGTQTHAGKARMRVEMSMNMEMAGMPQPMTMSMQMVGDGTTLWMEMENTMMGGKQVMKIAADKMEALASAAGGGGMAGQMSGMDPVKQVQELAETFDLALVSAEGGKVTLRADISDETRGQIAGPFAGNENLTEIVLVLDEATGFPSEMRLGGGEDPVMVMRFSNFKSLDEKTLDGSLFSYTPPEGTQVMDLGAMLGAMSGGGE